ncbi:MAG: hypothetical protein ACREJ2_02765 [Planctomycetota bacterium]
MAASPVQFQLTWAKSERTGRRSVVFAMSAGTEELGLVYAPEDQAEAALRGLIETIAMLGDPTAEVKPVALTDWSEKVRFKRFGTRENLRMGVNFGNVGGAKAAVRQEVGPCREVLGALRGAIEGLLRRIEAETPRPAWFEPLRAQLKELRAWPEAAP